MPGRGGLFMARVIDEYQVLGRYHVLILDRAAPQGPCRVKGQIIEPLALRGQGIPANCVAFRGTGTFRGATVESI